MKNIIKTVLFTALVLIAGIIIGYHVSRLGSKSYQFASDINSSISLIISIVALIIAFVTYFSIDAVDKKNRMDNNVLQMSEYNVSYPEIIKKLNVSDQMEYGKKLTELVVRKRKIDSCMTFSTWLQDIIDHLVWFAYYDSEHGWTEDSRMNLVNSLWREFKKYSEISSGVKLLLQENIKLIENVLLYQESRVKSSYILSSLEEVRCAIIPNPIAKLVYWNYLGLDYRKYVAGIMHNAVKQREFSKEYYEKWNSVKEFNDRNECLFWISKAIYEFRNAEKISEGDLLWSGYIKYNLVRCKIMKFVLLEEKDDDIVSEIKKSLDECLEIRTNICYLIKDEGYLKSKFVEERERAKELQDEFCGMY